MPISQWFNNEVDVYRLSDVADTDNQAWVAHLDGTSEVSCMIQPLDDAYGEDLEGGSYGKDFVLFCAVVDIKQGDKIVDGSTEYIVQGVESYDWQGFSHMELRIRITK